MNRCAAPVFPTNNLGTLQPLNAMGNGYVSAYTDKVRTGFNGGLGTAFGARIGGIGPHVVQMTPLDEPTWSICAHLDHIASLHLVLAVNHAPYKSLLHNGDEIEFARLLLVTEPRTGLGCASGVSVRVATSN